MAKNKSTVYLAYEDEEITLKHAGLLNSTTNKIGGMPDWPSGEIKVPGCPLCGTARPLLVQIYAPFELSQFHRTLYVFACLNPSCSANSKSWLCVRTQHLDMPTQAELISAVPPPAGAKKKKKSPKLQQQQQKISWCTGADDWGAGAEPCEEMDTGADDFQQQNEENGNVVSKIDNALVVGTAIGSSLIVSEEEDAIEEDEEEEDDSNSMENDLIYGFGQMEMQAAQNHVEDPNANCAAAAVADGNLLDAGMGAIANFSAEIECSENDVVLVETPKKPERDLIALLKHTPTPASLTDVTLRPFFMAVDVEQRQRNIDEHNFSGALSADHIRELYQEYRQRDETAHSPSEGGAVGGVCAGGAEEESYEKSLPAHGDLIFHHFVSTVQQNPGQILRYSRDTLPLLIAPLAEPVPKCPNCNGETICEVQILSTLIPKLRMQQNSEPAPIEYGNVLVFTCLKSCWDTPDKMRYERIIVQAEK